MRRNATPIRPLVTLVIVASALCMARAGARDAEIAAAIKSRVEAKKAVGMVVATIEPDRSSSVAAFGNAGPGARPLDADSVFEIGSITKVFTAILLKEVVWHNGGTGGYRTWLGFDKARRIAAVVLTNSVMSNDDLGFELVAGSAK